MRGPITVGGPERRTNGCPVRQRWNQRSAVQHSGAHSSCPNRWSVHAERRLTLRSSGLAFGQPLTSNVSLLEDKLVTVTAWRLLLFVTANFVSSFFSREETRIHVHVAHVDGEAKFWLTPQVALANHIGLTAIQVRQAQAVVNAHLKEIQDAWNQHFGG